MAEYIAKRRFAEYLDAASAGTNPGLIADTADAVYTLKQVGIDASRHVPRDVRHVGLAAFDTVVTMDNHVVQALRGIFPDLATDHLTRWRINDPYGDDLDEYRRCAELIHKELTRFVGNLTAHGA